MPSITLTVSDEVAERINAALEESDLTAKEYIINNLKQLVYNHEREVAITTMTMDEVDIS